jgi:hypothetical protein
MRDVSRERMAAQLLTGERASTAQAVVERLLAVQAQDSRGARLAIRARSDGLVAADVDRALTQERTLLVSWLNRGTLHLVRREDYPWLQQLTTPQLLTGNTRRLAQEGVTPDAADRGVAALGRALEDEGPLTRDQLRARISAAGVRTEGQALVHILALASFRGLIVRGPMVGGQQAFVLVRDWLGEVPAVDRDRALSWMARRYLAGHGPADERDLAKWAGLTLRDATRGLRAIGPELIERDDGLVDLPRAGSAKGIPPPRLLGAYEPLLLGWRSRDDFVPANKQRLITDNGLFRPFALVGGRAAGTWTLRAGAVSLDPFEALAPPDSAALATDAAEVVRFLGSAARGDGRGDPAIGETADS